MMKPRTWLLLCLASVQKLELGEGSLAQGTHSDWLCRRCQWPWGLPSQSASRRRTQGGRARGSPAPEQSTRLPPGSGERVVVRAGAGRGYNPGHPQSSPSKTNRCKRLSIFPRKQLPESTAPSLEKVEEAAQAFSAHCRGPIRALQEKKGKRLRQVSPIGWRNQERKKGVGRGEDWGWDREEDTASHQIPCRRG